MGDNSGDNGGNSGNSGDCAANFGSNAGPAEGFAPEPRPRVLVVFSGRTELAWLKMLRPGFRHCFALVEHAASEPASESGNEPGSEPGSEPASESASEPASASGGKGEHLWVLYNPLSNGTQLAVWAGINAADLQEALRRQGYRVVQTYARPASSRLYGWRPFTCVEAVKRALGLYAPGVFTPWQLYRLLKKCNCRKIILDFGVLLGYISF